MTNHRVHRQHKEFRQRHAVLCVLPVTWMVRIPEYMNSDMHSFGQSWIIQMLNLNSQTRSIVITVALCLLTCFCGCSKPETKTSTTSTQGKLKETAKRPTFKPKTANGKAPVEIVEFVSPVLTADEVAHGWISLFDGVSLYGWHANSDANWRVDSGEIVADDGDNGLLLTGFEIPNYELKCEFKLSKDGNSGIFLRTPVQPSNPAVDCYELNICDVHPSGFTTGGLVGRGKATVNGPTDGEWNTFHVQVNGPQVTVNLNGDVVLEYTDDTDAPLTTGFIGLQKRDGEIRFRNIHLRPLLSSPIFDGKSLDGWHVVDGSKSKFEVVDGAIHVEGGRGFLETDDAWSDFVLQADVKVNGDGLNSGLFFRSIRGTDNGYEYQIDNSLVDGDRSKPEDHGTGGIFKRIDARYVVGSDNEWTMMTLIAQGPNIFSWVNGYQVVEWTDTREPDENPRRGLRTQAGHILLQGHDPTTNLDFRNMRIVDLSVDN